MPVPYIISARQILYLQTILQRSDKEITNRIYQCQKLNPSPGDWCKIVEKDFETIGEPLDEDKISAFDTKEYKEHMKDKVRKTAFKDLEDIKVRENIYANLDRPQEYLTSKIFTNQQSFLIFALRRKTVRNINENFPNMNSDNSLCPVFERSPDTQQHILDCQDLKNILPMYTDVEYNKLFGTTQE